MHLNNSIRPREVEPLINKLIGFLGYNSVVQFLNRYEQRLQESGELLAEYHIKHKHPWAHALKKYFSLRQKGRSISKHIDNRLELLAGDSLKVYRLQNGMPASVKSKYRRDLLDFKQAKSFLFELYIAWHYALQNHTIRWCEPSQDKQPEFTVVTPSFDFDVECKRITLDVARKIRRRDFYRLVDLLIPDIIKLGLMGTIDIELKDRLHSGHTELSALSKELVNCFSETRQGSVALAIGNIKVDLKARNDSVLDWEIINSLANRTDNKGHTAVIANKAERGARNPIAINIQSEKSDDLLGAIHKKLRRATKRQLSPERPGLIVCLLEGIESLEGLESDSGLQQVTSDIVNRPNREHVVGISYSGEQLVAPGSRIKHYFSSALFFRNPSCKFPECRGYPFIGATN